MRCIAQRPHFRCLKVTDEAGDRLELGVDVISTKSELRKGVFPNDQSATSSLVLRRDNTVGAHVPSQFRIRNPPLNARYEIDPVLPSSQQMVELTAAVAGDVEWFVNNERILPQHDSRFFWQLARGEWNVRASVASEAPRKRLL